MKKTTGFTLIELLVVVALIGLLSTIVLSGVNSARTKAKDKTIMQELSHIRTVATMIYIDSASATYADLCSGGTINEGSSYSQLGDVETIIESLNGTGVNHVCYATVSSWCVRSALASGGNFCVDSNGLASTVTTTCNSTSPVICK